MGRIADRGAEHVGAREWMRICFELLELLKAHKKAIRRATVNTFGYIAKAIGYVTLELCSCTIVLFKAFFVDAVEALLTETLVSGQLYLRPPSRNPVFRNSHTNSVFHIQVSVSFSYGHLVCVPMVSSYESLHCILVFHQWAKAQIDNLPSSWTTKQVIWNHLFVSYYAGLTCLAENLMQTMDKQSAHAIK